uniref:Uncharacterized protein n=1 Tax=Picea glauca TaxID=3330 RepID=A0A101M4A2_PICGL|nr:hypothetical protein ABT39_MTgene645 [Picea glauca]QHR87026.1 hypothetical protein Q903MT_gene1035 [Picea sitchensis]
MGRWERVEYAKRALRLVCRSPGKRCSCLHSPIFPLLRPINMDSLKPHRSSMREKKHRHYIDI